MRPARQVPGPAAQSARSSTGTSSSRISIASSSTATPRMMPISFGGRGPERAKVKKTATITARGGEDHAARVREAADHRLARIVAAVPVLLGAREQEHRVVHRDREDHREEEHRPPGVEEALRLEAEQRLQRAVLEDPLGDAERGGGGQQVGEHAGGGDQRRLQREQQQQEAEPEDDADDERRLGRERGLEVVVLGDGAADASCPAAARRAAGRSSRRRRGPTGPAWGSPSRARGPRARSRRQDRGDAGSRCASGVTAAASPGGRDDLQRPGRAGAERAPGPARSRRARSRRGGTTLIEGIAVFSWVTGNARPSEHGERRMPVAERPAPEPLAPARRSARSGARRSAPTAARACRPCGPSLASTAGSSVSVAASTKITASMIPRLVERNAGLGTSITALSEIRTVSAAEQDGLAGGVHRHRGRVLGCQARAEEGAAEAVDDEQRVVDAEREREHQREVHRPDRDRQRAAWRGTASRRPRPVRAPSASAAARPRPASRTRCSRMPSVTGHEMTSERSIALRFAALKSDHMPAAPVRWTCTSPADSAASLPLSRSAARTISFEPCAAPACTIAVCPSREIEMPGAGCDDGRDRAVGAQGALDPGDDRPERPDRRRSSSARRRRSSGRSWRGRGSCGRSAARACTDCEPVASQPAPDSAFSTRGARHPSASATRAHAARTTRKWVAV